MTIGGENKLSLRYAYDGESKLASVTDDKGNQIVGYAYDDNGNLSERKVSGNNLTTTYTCDYQNRLTGMKNQTGSAGVVSEYSLEYLENGQKSKEVFRFLTKMERSEAAQPPIPMICWGVSGKRPEPKAKTSPILTTVITTVRK